MTKKASELLEESAAPFDAACMIVRQMESETEELTLMLDIFNSSIVTGAWPQKDSPCHKKILELMQRNGRKATAGSWE